MSSIIYINDIYLLSFLQFLIFFSFCISSSPSSPLLVVRVSCYLLVDLALGNYCYIIYIFAIDVGCRSRIVISLVVLSVCTGKLVSVSYTHLDVYKRQV